MSTESKNGDVLGRVSDFAKWAKPTPKVDISSATLDVLKSEIYRREQQLPFVQLVEQIISVAENKEAVLSRERLVYELHYDILGRPEMFIGYNVSDLTLEQILEEDEKIKKHKLPPRAEGEYRIVWSERFVVYDPGQVRPYAADSDKLQFFVGKFVDDVGIKMQKSDGLQELHGIL